MRDGVVRHFLLDVNGDDEEKHLANVERNLAVMEDPAVNFETFVISPERPEAEYDHYATPTLENVDRFVQEIRNRIDDDDELVIYVTGHGDRRDNRGSICLGDDCYTTEIEDLLQSITYGNRVVVMDQCLSGDWGHRFAAPGLRTRFYSSGSEDEVVCCAEFAPRFWSPDIEGLNWDERYQAALEQTISSHPLSLQSHEFVEGERLQFSTQVQNVSNSDELSSLLRSLGPEQYAVVFFSTQACFGCVLYNERFEELALEGEGRYLFIRAEGEEVEEDFGISSFPSVYIFDHQMRKHLVGDIQNVLGEMDQFNMSVADRLEVFRQRLDDVDTQSRRSALVAYAGLAEEGGIEVMLEALSVIEELTADQSDLVYVPAGQFLISMINSLCFKFTMTQRYRALLGNLDEIEDERLVNPDVMYSRLLNNLADSEKKEVRDALDYVMEASASSGGGEVEDRPVPPPDLLRRYLFHPNAEVRRIMTVFYQAYNALSLSDAEAASEISRVRELMWMTDLGILTESAREFGDLAEVLDIRRRSEAEQDFLNESMPQVIRYELAAVYVSLFRQLSEADREREKQIIFEQANVNSDNVIHTIIVFTTALGFFDEVVEAQEG